jgi:ABC-type amino acid transport substrate-binding protein
LLILTLTIQAAIVRNVTFSGGAKLDSYLSTVSVSILREAFKSKGIDFFAIHNPSLRSLRLSNSGIVDGELHRVSNFHNITKNKFKNLIKIESKLLSVKMAAFSLSDTQINSWKDLENKKVAYYRGRMNLNKLLAANNLQNNITKVNSDMQAFGMLLLSRVDFVITDRAQGNHLISSNHKFSKIQMSGILNEEKIYAYIHKKHKKLAPAIADSIESLKASGEISKIKTKINFLFNSK